MYQIYWLDQTPTDTHWGMSDTGWAKAVWTPKNQIDEFSTCFDQIGKGLIKTFTLLCFFFFMTGSGWT